MRGGLQRPGVTATRPEATPLHVLYCHGIVARTYANDVSIWGNQNVMSRARDSAMVADSAVRAYSCWLVLAYRLPRPRWQCAWSGRMPSASTRARDCWEWGLRTIRVNLQLELLCH